MDVSFILVDPTVPENIGAAARAIKTMGYSNLRLVRPCDYLCDKAKMLAHGSHEVLDNAQVFSSLEQALLDIDFSLATSAKQRWVKQNVIPCHEITDYLYRKKDTIESLAIVFGGEESGLSNHDIALCDRVVTIPLANPFPSLNLSQAVMVIAYSLSGIKQIEKQIVLKGVDNTGYKPLKNKVIEILSSIGITNDSLIHGRIIERLSEVSDEDINLLHSLASKIATALNQKKI